MAVVLLTGMSGAGKSTVLAALAERGVETVDTDDPGWIEVVDGERLWREERVRDLLDRPRDGPLVVSGTVANQGRFRDRFDAVVLLTAPLPVLLERVEHRLTNSYGRTAAERDAVVRDTRDVEPLLRAAATHVVDTTAPLEAVVARVVEVLS